MFNLNDLSILAAQQRAADLVREAERERRLDRVDRPHTEPLAGRVRAVTRWRATWARQLVRTSGRRSLPTPGGA